MKKTWPMIASGAALLAACGGGGGGSEAMAPAPPPTVAGTDVPVSATQDPKAAFDFVASVAATKSENTDPLIVGDATLATTDTDEPQPL